MIGWVNIGILAGLAAIAIPVIVHLLRSRQFQTVELGTLRFLREAVEESARWRRLRDLLLLLLRLLAVALLTLLFARPFLTRSGAVSDRDQETVLLVDSSGSMAGHLLGGTAWDYARRRVDDLLAELPESGRLTVAVFADSVTEVPDWQAFAATPGGATDTLGALRWARDRLALSTARHRHVVLVTDMQAAGLPAVRPPDWPADIPVRLVPIPAAGAYNAGIAAVECATPYPKGDAIVQVRVATSGEVPRTAGAQVVLELDGQDPVRTTVPLASQVVDIPIPGRPGLKQGTVRLEADDEYPADNRRPFAFYLHNPAPVLLVDGDPQPSPFESETYFLAKVLETARNDAGRSAYAVTVSPDLGSLPDCTAVALCNVPSLTHNQARDLAAFVNRGGALLVFLGDRCDPTAYARLRRFNAFPLEFRPKRVPIPSPWLAWNAQHPALAAFGGLDTGNLSRIVFRDAFDMKPDKDEQVLARLASDMPALLVHSYGAGRVVIVTNPCTREWTNWPAERIFLPLIRELFSYATRGVGTSRPIVVRSPGIAESREPGVYVTDASVHVVAPAPAEIDTAPCDEAAFRRALALPPALETETDEQTAGLPEGRERRNEIWRWLAVALIAALLLENIIADRGRPG